MSNVYSKLLLIQNELKAPKSQYNSFGKYNYRSCEDILEALKPLCEKHKAVVLIKDEIVNIDERFYIKAVVELIDVESGEKVVAEALAREEESKKGMDSCQVTGSTSSYARKYALNGMFAIDDTKDSDGTNTHEKEKKPPQMDKPKTNQNKTQLISEPQVKRLYALAKGKDTGVIKELLKVYGFDSAKEIVIDKYNEICSAIENL